MRPAGQAPAVTNPDNTVFAVKRLIAAVFDDPITKKTPSWSRTRCQGPNATPGSMPAVRTIRLRKSRLSSCRR